MLDDRADPFPCAPPLGSPSVADEPASEVSLPQSVESCMGAIHEYQNQCPPRRRPSRPPRVDANAPFAWPATRAIPKRSPWRRSEAAIGRQLPGAARYRVLASAEVVRL